MKISQLEYFCTVAKTEHITKTANLLNITQPALTSAIQRMEEELAISLFQHKGRNIQLSKSGKVVYRYAQEIMDSWNKMQNELKKITSMEQTTVHMICSTHILSPELMAKMLEKMPDISIRVHSPLNEDAFHLFDKKEIDLIVNHPMYTGENIKTTVLEQDEMVVISAKGSRLSQENTGDLALSTLADYQFASYPEGTPLRKEFEEFCRERGFVPRIVFGANTVREMLPLIMASSVIAFVPLRTLDDIYEPALQVWHISDIEKMPCVGISWHADAPRKEAVEVVRACILDYFHVC